MRFLTAFAVVFLSCISAFAQPLPEEAEGMSCEEPVLWIAKYGPKEFAKPYCDGCLPGRGDSCDEEVQKRGQHVTFSPKEYVREGVTRVELGACRIASYQHQLIRAWHGRPVERAWRARLKAQHDWVGKRARISYPESALPLLNELTATRAQCGELERKYAKFLRPAQRFVRAGKADAPIASEYDGFGGPGLGTRLMWGGARKGSWSTVSIFEEPQTLGNVFSEEPKQPYKGAPSFHEDDFRPGLTPEWRARKYVAVVSFFERGGGFRCWGECEGGYSLDLYLDQEGELIGQMAMMSACPYVYTAPAGSEAFVQQGEILRNLRRPELETTQTLRISGEAEACAEGLLRVRLTEEKPELTYLDDISLRVGDVVLKPDSCGDAAYCSNDGTYAEIGEGEKLEFVFAIPEAARNACEDLELQADGYYIPLD